MFYDVAIIKDQLKIGESILPKNVRTCVLDIIVKEKKTYYLGQILVLDEEYTIITKTNTVIPIKKKGNDFKVGFITVPDCLKELYVPISYYDSFDIIDITDNGSNYSIEFKGKKKTRFPDLVIDGLVLIEHYNVSFFKMYRSKGSLIACLIDEGKAIEFPYTFLLSPPTKVLPFKKI